MKCGAGESSDGDGRSQQIHNQFQAKYRPIRRYLHQTGKSLFEQDCVVGLGGLELLTKRLSAAALSLANIALVLTIWFLGDDSGADLADLECADQQSSVDKVLFPPPLPMDKHLKAFVQLCC
jgi:hypothetical protein